MHNYYTLQTGRKWPSRCWRRAGHVCGLPESIECEILSMSSGRMCFGPNSGCLEIRIYRQLYIYIYIANIMCGCRGVGCRVCEGIVDGITEVTIGTECPVDKLNYHLYYFNKTKCRGGLLI